MYLPYTINLGDYISKTHPPDKLNERLYSLELGPKDLNYILHLTSSDIIFDLMSEDLEQIYRGLDIFQIKLNTLDLNYLNRDVLKKRTLKLLIPRINQIFDNFEIPLLSHKILNILNHYGLSSVRSVKIFLKNGGIQMLLKKLSTTDFLVLKHTLHTIGYRSHCSRKFDYLILQYQGITLFNKLMLRNKEIRNVVLMLLIEVFTGIQHPIGSGIITNEILQLIQSYHMFLTENKETCEYCCQGIVLLVEIECAHTEMMHIANQIMSIINTKVMEQNIEFLLEPITFMLLTYQETYINNLKQSYFDIMENLLLKENTKNIVYSQLILLADRAGSLQLDMIRNNKLMSYLFKSISLTTNVSEYENWFDIITGLINIKNLVDEKTIQRIDGLIEQGLLELFINNFVQQKLVNKSLVLFDYIVRQKYRFSKDPGYLEIPQMLGNTRLLGFQNQNYEPFSYFTGRLIYLFKKKS